MAAVRTLKDVCEPVFRAFGFETVNYEYAVFRTDAVKARAYSIR